MDDNVRWVIMTAEEHDALKIAARYFEVDHLDPDAWGQETRDAIARLNRLIGKWDRSMPVAKGPQR